jgi:hypothetical protein
MSTRSITHIHESFSGNEKIVCSFYRHCDGYPEGHGEDLKQWLDGKTLANGVGQDFVKCRDFNCAGEMAVQLMAHIQSIADASVIPAGAGGMWEEYTYHVYFRSGKFDVLCEKA